MSFSRILLLFCLMACMFSAQAQRRNSRYNDYIRQYAPLAVEQMKRYKIPASITLAQGLLESGATGVAVGSIMMTMLVASASVLTAIHVTLMRTTPSSFVKGSATPSSSTSRLPTTGGGPRG